MCCFEGPKLNLSECCQSKGKDAQNDFPDLWCKIAFNIPKIYDERNWYTISRHRYRFKEIQPSPVVLSANP